MTDEIKAKIDEIAPEVFKLQDLRRANTITEEQRIRLEGLEKEYNRLMGKLADATVEMLKKEGLVN